VIDDFGLRPAELFVAEDGAQDIERGEHGRVSKLENRAEQHPWRFAADPIWAYGVADPDRE
jgi:hypothetical protein